MKTLTAYIEYDEQTKLYVGLIPGIIGAHTQAETLDELNMEKQQLFQTIKAEIWQFLLLKQY